MVIRLLATVRAGGAQRLTVAALTFDDAQRSKMMVPL